MTSLEKKILNNWSISTASLIALRDRVAMWQHSLTDLMVGYYENIHCVDAVYQFEVQYKQISINRKVDLERIRIISKYLVETTEEINRLVVQ